MRTEFIIGTSWCRVLPCGACGKYYQYRGIVFVRIRPWGLCQTCGGPKRVAELYGTALRRDNITFT